MRVRPQSSPRTVTLGPTIGSGGFGTAYDAPAGGYLYKTGEIDFAKVSHLIANRVAPSREGYRYAWPELLAYAPDSESPVGYAMAKAEDGIETQALFSRVNVPEWFRVRVALNHVRSLIDLEAAGYRRGDMPNSLCHQEASITEIDLDSLQVNHPDGQFNGGDVKAITAPPEVLTYYDAGGARGFKTTREHDAWSIACLVWLLLMRGEHPFDAVRVGPHAAPNLAERVKLGQWPHDPHCLEASPRPGSRPFGSLDPALQSLFRQTFVDGHPNHSPDARPTLQAWEAALERIDGELT